MRALASFALAVTSVTMALTPLLSFAGRRFAARLRASGVAASELMARPSAGQKHAIVVGYGRVGKVVCALLEGAWHSLYRGRFRMPRP